MEPNLQIGHFPWGAVVGGGGLGWLSVSHGLRGGVQRSRGRAKVTHRAGGGAGSPACASVRSLATAQASGVLGSVPGLPH